MIQMYTPHTHTPNVAHREGNGCLAKGLCHTPPLPLPRKCEAIPSVLPRKCVTGRDSKPAPCPCAGLASGLSTDLSSSCFCLPPAGAYPEPSQGPSVQPQLLLIFHSELEARTPGSTPLLCTHGICSLWDLRSLGPGDVWLSVRDISVTGLSPSQGCSCYRQRTLWPKEWGLEPAEAGPAGGWPTRY